MDGESGASQPAPQIVVLVDPVGTSSSTGYLVDTLKDQGYELLAFCGQESGKRKRSGEEEVEAGHTSRAPFVQSRAYETRGGLPVLGAAAKEARHFQALNVQAVMPASEQGVMMAEMLAAELGLPGNDPKTVDVRRNKFQMQEALREAGVRATKQIVTDSLGVAQAWRRENTEFPIIVKPMLSYWQDGVHLCVSDEDIATAFAEELHKVTAAGTTNQELLVQEFLVGTEYAVECVSHKGQHMVVGVETYDKRPTQHEKTPVYFTISLVDSDEHAVPALSAYVFSVLDALGVREGPSHSEVMLCADGPCLIETASRLQGGNWPETIKAAAGVGPLDLWIDVALQGGRLFQNLASNEYLYKLKQYGMLTLLMNDVAEGTLGRGLDHGGRITGLASVVSFLPHVQPGGAVQFTRNLFSSPGIVRHVGAKEQCLRDSAAIREIENQIYRVLASS